MLFILNIALANSKIFEVSKKRSFNKAIVNKSFVNLVVKLFINETLC